MWWVNVYLRNVFVLCPPTHCHQPQFVFLLKMRVNWPFCYMIPPRASLTHGDTFLDYKTADCHGVVMGISDHVITSCSFLCYLVSNHLAWPSWTILLRSKSNSFLLLIWQRIVKFYYLTYFPKSLKLHSFCRLLKFTTHVKSSAFLENIFTELARRRYLGRAMLYVVFQCHVSNNIEHI